uniref:Uncharacterized protein n=1 Tax=Anguilla anguilla TaxID=7936 RepID=A0A0E9VSW0_ANGAN
MILNIVLSLTLLTGCCLCITPSPVLWNF